MNASMTSVLARPRAGLQEEIERIEGEDGTKPDGSLRPRRTATSRSRTHDEARLNTELLRRARADASITSVRRAPCTVVEMPARLAAATGATEDDLNRDLDNPADWDETVARTVLPQAAAGGARVVGGTR